jgi:hypothetical protein
LPDPAPAPAAGAPAAAAAAAAAAVTQPPHNGGGGEAFYTPWKLDKDGVDWIEGHKFTDPAAVIKSAKHFETVARDKNALVRPEKGKEKDWSGWEELGWIKDPAQYTFEEPKELPKGMLYDKGMDEELRKFAHENRIPLATARAARDLLLAGQKRQFEAFVGEGARSAAELKESLIKDWGADYQTNTELARRAMGALGIGVTDAAELEAVIGAPRLVKLFHGIAQKIGEQALPAPGGTPSLAMTPAAARAERLRLEADKDWLRQFQDGRDPQHAGAVARRAQLLEIESKGAHL